jgi:hypothetical protein
MNNWTLGRCIINWMVSPICTMTPPVLLGWWLGVQFTWPIIFVMLTAIITSDIADRVFEGRPIEGPRRWTK